MQVYKCKKCGSLVSEIIDGGFCGGNMDLVEANTTDAATEKHVPVVEVSGNKVVAKVGEVEHPMLEEHHIQSIILETKNGFQVKKLHAGDKPCAIFLLAEGEEAVAVYEYCNLHGLWKKEL